MLTVFLAGQSPTPAPCRLIVSMRSFKLGQQSRKSLKDFIETFPVQEWDVPQELKLMNSSLKATPRKIVVHVLLHEIRHWAQIATLLRLTGVTDGFHDILFSPAMGGKVKHKK
jgi:uncharacterized damage-inducible protein DinB